MTDALRFRDYGFMYSVADTPAVSNVTLDLPAGCVTSVIAPQGAGKTTLLRAAAGLLGEIYQGTTTGAIEFPAPHSTTQPPNHPSSPRASGQARPSAAFFDGYVQVTLAVETVREEIGLPLMAVGIPRDERELRAQAVAHELRIEHLLDRNVTALSGGEEKLVGIAAALIPDVGIHIIDEPFEQLDVAHLAAVIRACKRRARAGRLVLVATGSIDIALNIADAAVVFGDGGWKVVLSPTYATVAAQSVVGESPVMNFLTEHHATADGVRRFREAVRKAS